jgi:hypothetical protein
MVELGEDGAGMSHHTGWNIDTVAAVLMAAHFENRTVQLEQ